MADRPMNLIPIRVWTPDNEDPPGVNDFYRALGSYLVAWGRLEGQFMGNLLTITNLLRGELPPKELPINWKRRATLWKQGFNGVPELEPYRRLALEILPVIESRVEERNFIAHATWGHFTSAV